MAERDDAEPGAMVPEDPLAPATPEELEEARRLRDALEDPSIPSDEAALSRALKQAWTPAELSADELELLVAAAVDAPARAAADDLARVLDGGAATSAEGELVVALRAAWSPSPIDEAEHAALVARAVGPVVATTTTPAATTPAVPSRSNVVRIAFGAGVSVLALAASVLLFVNVNEREAPAAPLARARSTQPLFAEPFRPGEASARIDRIALARASDLRDNRFARWGVKR